MGKAAFRKSLLRVAVVALAACAQFAGAQSDGEPGYPSKPVRIIVPVAAGGATDLIARVIAQRLGAVWNQRVIVDNRPGGGSNIGFEVAAKSPPDGYTLLLAQPAFTVNVSLYDKLAYDPVRSFSPITRAAVSANVLVVHPAVPARRLQELVALAKARPGELTYGSSGNGTTPHLSGELFKSMASIDIVHVPYRGASAAIADLLGGHVDMAFTSLSAVVGYVKAGKLRALAVTSAKRSPLMPDLPTFAESGLKGFEVHGWYGFLVPAGVRAEIVNRLHADITQALAHPEVLQAFERAGLEPVGPNSPEEFGAFIRSEISKWARVVTASGARAN